MGECGKPTLPNDRDRLLAKIESLDKQIYRKQLELDILNKAVELAKKEQGIDPRKLANKEKAGLIDALRTKYPLNELLMMMYMPKSSYLYQKEAQHRPEKHTTLRAETKSIFAENQKRYGYRRMHAMMRSKGIVFQRRLSEGL
ncbi:MAG: IS3 family transposase [Firmicutes bacterium]|nr:IS3 family transposase [Bacillota bacterium]